MRDFIVIICFFLLACSSNDNGDILVTYEDHSLSFSDVYNYMNSNDIDTNIFIKDYLDNWLRHRVFLDQAYLYIDHEDDDIDRIIQDYRENLVIQKYKNELSRNKFDNIISDQDISKYYYDNQQNFILMKDIFKGRLIILQKNNVVLSEFQNLIDASSDADLYKLVSLCRSYSIDNILNDSVWRYSSDFTLRLPFIEKESYDRLFLKNKIFNFSDEKYDYIFPSIELSGDNAAMIGMVGLEKFKLNQYKLIIIVPNTFM